MSPSHFVAVLGGRTNLHTCCVETVRTAQVAGIGNVFKVRRRRGIEADFGKEVINDLNLLFRFSCIQPTN